MSSKPTLPLVYVGQVYNTRSNTWLSTMKMRATPQRALADALLAMPDGCRKARSINFDRIQKDTIPCMVANFL